MANLTDFPTIRPNFLMDFANSGQIDPRIEFSRSTTATRVNQKGMIENVPANVPRIDYDRSSGACLGMLVEGQSTNMLLHSSDMTHEYWQKIKAGAGLAAIVVMCATTPRDPKEWAIGLISTVVSSIGGGAAVAMYFGFQHWALEPMGLVALLGLCFACGLPGWALVRWTFNMIRQREGQGIDTIAREVRNGL